MSEQLTFPTLATALLEIEAARQGIERREQRIAAILAGLSPADLKRVIDMLSVAGREGLADNHEVGESLGAETDLVADIDHQTRHLLSLLRPLDSVVVTIRVEKRRLNPPRLDKPVADGAVFIPVKRLVELWHEIVSRDPVTTSTPNQDQEAGVRQ